MGRPLNRGRPLRIEILLIILIAPVCYKIISDSAQSGGHDRKTMPAHRFSTPVRGGALSREHARPRARRGEILSRRRRNYPRGLEPRFPPTQKTTPLEGVVLITKE